MNEVQKLRDAYDEFEPKILHHAWVMVALEVYMAIREAILWYFYPGGEDDLVTMQEQQTLELNVLKARVTDWATFRSEVQAWVTKWKNRYHTELQLAIPAWQIPTLRARVTAIEGELDWAATPRRLARIEARLTQAETTAGEALQKIDALLQDKPWEGEGVLSAEDREALDKLKAGLGGFADLGSWWQVEWQGKLDNLTELDLDRLQTGMPSLSTWQTDMLRWWEDAGRQNQLTGNLFAGAIWATTFDPTLTPDNLWAQLAAKVFADPAAEPGGPRRQAETVSDAVFGLKHALMETIPPDARKM